MRVLQMLPGFLRGHGARLQHQDAGDDLKAVGDTVLQLPEQHILMPQQLLRLPQQFFLLAFDGPPLGDILESKKKGRAGVVRVEHRAGVQEHDAAANPGKLMLDLERVHGGALRDDFLQKLAKSWNVPLTIAERVEWPAQNFLAVAPERQIVGALTVSTQKSPSNTSRGSRTVSTMACARARASSMS